MEKACPFSGATSSSACYGDMQVRKLTPVHVHRIVLCYAPSPKER